MELKTSDYSKYIEIGSGDMLDSIAATMNKYYPDQSRNLSQIFAFFNTGNAFPKDMKQLINELEMVTSCLKKIPPENAIYGPESKKRHAPWKNGIADTVTSCADLFLTSDGKNLLKELKNLLQYANDNQQSISFM